MWLLFYPSCLLLTFSLGFSQSYGHFFDPVYCSTDTPNCTLYINQTVTFICKCSATNCVTSWKFSDNSTPVRSGVNCTRNVTEDLMGVATCHSNSRPPNDAYKWNVTVLHPKPPKFLVTPSGTKTINIGGANGAAATCLICVNCTVRGAPAPTVTWQYQSGNMFGFNSVITNQSNASSPYYQLDNGQKLCFDDVRRYDLVDGTTYQCTATNVGGTISTTFNALVHSYPLPIPGPSATTGTLYSGGKNVTLLMDSVYPGSDAYFKVYRYNRSSPDTLISSCYCNGPTPCEFGELAGHTEKNYVSCQLNTSYSGLYQFQIYTTTIYPCFLNIGHPIEVNDVDPPTSTKNFKMNFHILSYSLGGLCVLLVVGILGTFCGTRRFYRRQPQRYAVLDGDHQNADNPVEGGNYTDNSGEFPNTDSNEFPNEQTPLLPKPEPDYTARPVESSSEQKTEHVHGRMQAIMGDTNYQYTIDRSFEGPSEAQGSIEHPPTDNSMSSEELFSIDRKNNELLSSHCCTKEQELVDPNDYSVLHIGSSHNNMGGVKRFVSHQADLLPVCLENADTVNNSSDEVPLKDANEHALVPYQKALARKVVYIIHYSDSKEWITSQLKPILDDLGVEILTIEDAVVGQTIANARDELVNKADKVIVVFSRKSKEDKNALESKWLQYDLERVKHKNPDPNKISFIPILYEDTEQKDLPRPLDNMIALKADSENLKEKLKESIFDKH